MTIKIINLIICLTTIGFLIFMAIRSKKRLRHFREEEGKAMKDLEKWGKEIKGRTEEAKKFFDNLNKETKKMEEDLHRKESYKQGVCDDVVDGEINPYNAFDAAGIPRDTILDNNLIVATTEDGLVFFTRADLIVYPGLKLDEWMEMEL